MTLKPTLKLLLLAALLVAPLTVHAIAPTALKTEFLENPLGIDTVKPRFSWIVEETTPGAKQTAYQVQVASSPEKLARGEADLWDSGKVASDETLGVEYGGQPLASRTFCWWRIRAWGGAGEESFWSKPTMFSVGLLQPQDWQGKWICAPPGQTVGPHFGFRSSDAKSEDEVRWVQVDLGAERKLEGVALWGAWPVDASTPRGDGFPLRFKLEASRREDFSEVAVLADQTTADITNPGLGPLRLDFAPVPARYVRLTATKLSGSWKLSGRSSGVWDEQTESWLAIPDPVANHLSRWKLALAEMEVFAEGRNVALGATVSASDSFEDDVKTKKEDYEREGWKRQFLTDGRTEGTAGGGRTPQPATLLRRTFDARLPIKRAVLYATALGNYEVRINGAKVGDQKLAPGWVNYGKRVLYQCHDVTPLLRRGANAIAAILADGWYRMPRGGDKFGSSRRVLPAEPARFLGQLEIEYADGSLETVATDGSWQCHTDGPLRYASMYYGIIYDVRREIAGWDQPGAIGGWQPVAVQPALPIALTAQMHEPVRVLRLIKPVAVTQPKPGVIIYDFGTSMAGFCRVTLDGPAGSDLKLRYAEALKADGTLYLGNLQGVHDNGDRYILAGQGPRTFEPDFTYHGFRYVELTGATSVAQVKEIAACDVSSDMRQIGFFESSDRRLNQLCATVERAYRSNMPSIIVDCAGRDERLAWMGDCLTDEAQSIAYLFDAGTFLANLGRGVVEGRNADGIPHAHPVRTQPPGARAIAGWNDGGIAATWAAWLNYGDRRALETGYAGAAHFMDAVAKRAKDGFPGPNYQTHWGDWLSARMTIRPGAKSWDELGGIGAPSNLFAAAMWGRSVDLTARMAQALGKVEDARRFSDLLGTIRAGIVRAFVRPDGTVEGGEPSNYALLVAPRSAPAGGDEQSCYALTLGLDHLPGDLREKAKQQLLKAIRGHDEHLATGSFTTIYLLRFLVDHGLQDLAYRMVMQPTPPSYGAMVDNGATAMWERLDGYHPQLGFNPHQMNALNHLGMNSVYEWVFATLAGIRPDPAHPGYKHFFIEPKPPQGLDWVKARYDSVRGPIRVEWKVEEKRMVIKAAVPPNTTATVRLPAIRTSRVTVNGRREANEVFEVSSGHWEIILDRP